MIVPSHLILCSWQPVHMCYNIWWCDTPGARGSANINVRCDHAILTTAGISAFKSHIPAFMCMIHVLKNKFALVYDSLILCSISHEICTQFLLYFLFLWSDHLFDVIYFPILTGVALQSSGQYPDFARANQITQNYMDWINYQQTKTEHNKVQNWSIIGPGDYTDLL